MLELEINTPIVFVFVYGNSLSSVSRYSRRSAFNRLVVGSNPT